MAVWRFYSSQGECDGSDDTVDERIEVTRLKVPGAPVFSLAKIPEVLPDGSTVRQRHKPPGIYLGTSSKEVITWMLGSKDVTDKVVLDGHTGWVRSLAVTGKWLFSCGCNWLRLWDTTYGTPKEQQAVRLFTGDILSIAATNGQVFTAGADGSLRSWSITRAGGLVEGPAVERAHEGRVAACVAHGSCVITASYDGSVKVWCASSLTLLAEARGAHGGEKVFCATVGANGVLFTGGDDKFVRAWDLSLNPLGTPMCGHAASVRVLAAGRRAMLVSGDADGDVCIWETYPVDLPPPPYAASLPAAAAAGDDILAGGSIAVAPAAEPVSSPDGMAELVLHQLDELASPLQSEVHELAASEPVAEAEVPQVQAQACEPAEVASSEESEATEEALPVAVEAMLALETLEVTMAQPMEVAAATEPPLIDVGTAVEAHVVAEASDAGAAWASEAVALPAVAIEEPVGTVGVDVNGFHEHAVANGHVQGAEVPAADPVVLNGHAAQSNGHSNGHANGHADDHANGHEAHANGHLADVVIAPREEAQPMPSRMEVGLREVEVYSVAAAVAAAVLSKEAEARSQAAVARARGS